MCNKCKVNKWSIVFLLLTVLGLCTFSILANSVAKDTDRRCQENAKEICEHYCGPIE